MTACADMPDAVPVERALAEYLERTVDEIALRMIAEFDKAHPDSVLGSLPMDERHDWIALEMERLIATIRTGRPPERKFPYQPNIAGMPDAASWGAADMVNVFENGLNMEDYILPFVWREFAPDPVRLYEAVMCLRTASLLFVKANAMSFASGMAEDVAEARWAAAVEERRRIAQEMYDNFGHALALLRRKTSLMRELIREGSMKEALVTLTEMKLIESDASEGAFGMRAKALAEREVSRLREAPPAEGRSAAEEELERGALEREALEREALASPSGLTPRELEVMSYVAAGKTNPEIAHALSISENTVKNHLSSILDKLQLKNRTQIAAFAAHLRRPGSGR